MTANVFDNDSYKKLENFRKFLENRGFKNKENELTFKLYYRFDEFWTSVIVISNRLDIETKRFEELTKKTFEQIRNNSIDENTGKEGINILFELITDLKSFYFFMRELLDILTQILKELNKNHSITLKDSFNAFTKGYERYSKINPEFFNKIFREKLIKFVKFIDERDGLIHKLHSVSFTNDKDGNLGFDIMKSRNQTTGTDYVTSINRFKNNASSRIFG